MQGGTFRYAITEPDAIVPARAADPAGMAVVGAVFDSLTAYDAALQVVPAAATSWEPLDEEGRVWRFELRRGAAFHDGGPVTAADFVAGWAAVLRGGVHAHLLADVVGAAAVANGTADTVAGLIAADDHTLEVRLRTPRADFPAVAGHPSLAPVPPAALTAPDAFSVRPIGNGPFQLTESWARGRFVRTARFDGWLNGPAPRLGGVLFQIADVDTSFLAFRQGRRDYATLPPDALAQAREEFPHRGATPYEGPGVITAPRAATYFLAFDITDPPYDDQAVRRAVSLIVDRPRVAEVLEGGNLSVARSLIPPVLPRAPDASCSACTFNPVGASTTFEERGLTQLRFAFDRGGGHETVRNVLRDVLSDLGIALVSNRREPPPDFATFRERILAGQAGMFRFGWQADVPTLDAMLYPLLHSSQRPPVGGTNLMRYDNPQVDTLLEDARATLDPVRRARLQRRAEAIALNADQVVVPVVHQHLAGVAAQRVTGLRVSPLGAVNLAEVSLSGS